VDSAGNAYVTGETDSLDFPTANALQEFGGGRSDAFVAKLNPMGSALVFSTYLGGQSGSGGGDSAGTDIALDNQGRIHITGQTTSADFLTVYPAQAAYAGAGDAFVAKIGQQQRVFLPLIVR